MAKSIKLTGAQKWRQKHTLQEAINYLRVGGWFVALLPLLYSGLVLYELAANVDLSVQTYRGVGRLINLVWLFVTLFDFMYLWAFFEEKLRRWAWWLVLFLGGPFLCVFYMSKRKRVLQHDKQLKSVAAKQFVGMVISVVVTLALWLLASVASYNRPPECWDPDVQTIFADVLQEAGAHNANIGNTVEQDYVDGVRVCVALDVKYNDAEYWQEHYLSHITYTVQIVDGQNGRNFLVSIPKQ